ncbi:MAG TPA: hypothetical protein VIL36_11030 [Acidimicrobiales bacterium]
MADASDDGDLPPDLDHARARLYAEPLTGFVAARDALVRALRGAGRADDAKAVKALRKPSRVAWILDAGFRSDPDGTERLAAAVNDVIEAQAGRGDMRDATRGLRDAAQAVAKAAADAAAAAEVNVDRSTLVPAVLAVVADPVAFAELRQGILAEVPAAGALDVLTNPPPLLPVSPAAVAAALERDRAGAAEPGEVSPTPPPVDLAARRRAREAVAAAEKAADEARRAADDAEAAVKDARARLEAAEETFRQAEADVKAARESLHDAQQTAKSLRAAARDADRTLSQARKQSPPD